MTEKSDPAVEFEHLLDQGVYQAAWRYACWLSASREDAEDLLQESLIRAYQCFHQLRDRSCFRSWLLRIVRQHALLIRRSGNSRLTRLTVPLEEQSVAPVSLSTSADADPLSVQLAAAIAALPVAQRELLALFYFEGFSLKEIAQVLRITPNSVVQRLHRARFTLRRAVVPDPQLVQTELTQQGVIQ